MSKSGGSLLSEKWKYPVVIVNKLEHGVWVYIGKETLEVVIVQVNRNGIVGDTHNMYGQAFPKDKFPSSLDDFCLPDDFAVPPASINEVLRLLGEANVDLSTITADLVGQPNSASS